MAIKSFTYNRLFSCSVTFGLSILLILLIIRSTQLKDPSQVHVLIYFGVFILAFLAIVIVKFLIPSINQNPALELNELSLIDKVRNREVFWENIKEIRLVNFRRGGAGICIDLIDKALFLSELKASQKLLSWISNLSYGTPFVLPLQFISGSNQEIFEAIVSYRSQLNTGHAAVSVHSIGGEFQKK
jgi:hypothetical protein